MQQEIIKAREANAQLITFDKIEKITSQKLGDKGFNFKFVNKLTNQYAQNLGNINEYYDKTK